MNFEKLMSYFRLKGMLHNERRVYGMEVHDMYSDGDKHHELYSVDIMKDANLSFEVAKVIFKKTGGRMALVYADIVYNRYNKSPVVNKVNANLADLKNTLLGYDHDII